MFLEIGNSVVLSDRGKKLIKHFRQVDEFKRCRASRYLATLAQTHEY